MKNKKYNFDGIGVLIISATIIFAPVFGLGPMFTIVQVAIAIVFGYLESGRGVFQSFGLTKSHFHFQNLLLKAPLAAIFLVVIYQFLFRPVATVIGKSEVDLSLFYGLEGNTTLLMTMLPFVWISAALGEEIIFRGYLFPRIEKLLGGKITATVLAIVISSVLFGMGHRYQGASGMIITGLVGLTFCVTYQYRKKDLWFTVMIHGFFDTIALMIFYLGLHEHLL